MKIGDRVEVLDCIYEAEDVCKGNFGVISEIRKPLNETLFMVKLESDCDEHWAYLANELRVVS